MIGDSLCGAQCRQLTACGCTGGFSNGQHLLDDATAVRHQLGVASPVQSLRLGRRQRELRLGLGRLQAGIGGIEARQDLAGLDCRSDIDAAFDNLAGDAKAQSGFDAGTHLVAVAAVDAIDRRIAGADFQGEYQLQRCLPRGSLAASAEQKRNKEQCGGSHGSSFRPAGWAKGSAHGGQDHRHR